ncbi:MAG TPA: YdcF family protein [Lachnospiraceae bacterium]
MKEKENNRGELWKWKPSKKVEGRECLDFLIILGAEVYGYSPCPALKYRLDAAVFYLSSSPETNVIVSGGQGPDENITEASCMANYLMNAGISKDRIWMEERATSTWENISYSYDLMETSPGDYKVGIVTNDFHILRSILVAKKLGKYQVWGMATKSDMSSKLRYSIREIFALVLYKMQGKL